MLAYVLARTDEPDLETIIYETQMGDATFVFTNDADAESYLTQSGDADNYSVAELQPIEFVEWMLKCRKNGVESMVINPSFQEHSSGKLMNSVNIEAHLEHFGLHFLEIADPTVF